MPGGGHVTYYTQHCAPEVHTARSDGLTVYYPFALVDLLDYCQADDDKEGEVLFAFMDEDGCRVSIRMRRELVDELKQRLCVPPNSSS